MKVLYFLRGLNIGGAETFAYNVLEKIDSEKYHIDFVIQDKEIKNTALQLFCENTQSNIYTIPAFEKHYLSSIYQCVKLIKKNRYDVVHYHANSLINMAPYYSCVITNTNLIIHSHNSSNNLGGKFGRFLHSLNRKYLANKPIGRLACSDKAGKWMFGNKEYTLVNNGINIDKFKYSAQNASKLRKKYNISESDIVIGHIGRFTEAKNHKFLIECFQQIARIKEAKLVMVGDGPLLDGFKRIYGNDPNIIFIGGVQNTSELYSLFDIMIFPSVFEGLPFVLVEAQASGLPVLASDFITKEVNVTELINYYSLENSSELWANEALRILSSSKNKRLMIGEQMKNTIFDSDLTVKILCSIYSNYEREF